MKKILLLYVSVLGFLTVGAQYRPLWIEPIGKEHDEKFFGLSRHFTHDFVLAGEYRSQNSKFVYPYIAKLTPGGTLLWDKFYETPYHTTLTAVATDSDKNIYGVGFTKDNEWDPYTEFYLIKLNEQGVKMWERTIRGPGYDRINDMVYNAGDNTFTLAGYQDVQFYNEHRAVMMKVDTAGTAIWKYVYSGSSGEEILSMTATNDGGYAFVGYEKVSLMGDRVVLVGKVDAMGNEQWIQNFPEGMIAIGNSIIEEPNGNLALCGMVREAGAPVYDVLLMTLNAQGEQIWKKVIHKENNEEAADLAMNDKGHLMVLAYVRSQIQDRSDIWLSEYNTEGELIWDYQQRTATIDFGYRMLFDRYGNLVVAGSTYNFIGQNWDGVVLYFDKSKAPILDMQNPPKERTMVDEPQFELTAQVKSPDTTLIVQAEINGKLVDGLTQVLSKSDGLYTLKFSANTLLQKGPNSVRVKALNAHGETQSTLHAVYYLPRPKHRRGGERR